jgi:tetratricopeptide (TPR) repeat protein
MTQGWLHWRSVLITALLLCPLPVLAAGTPGTTSAETQALSGDAAAAAAADHYREAMAFKAKAWRQEALAADSVERGSQRAALAAERGAYQEMIAQLQQALKVAPRYVEAATELGYALRQTGNYRKAIGAYNFALGINDRHFEAVEYRGQAYLEMNNLEKAKQDYMRLFQHSPELADKLISAMDRWLAGQPTGSADTFSLWLGERKALAGEAFTRLDRW